MDFFQYPPSSIVDLFETNIPITRIGKYLTLIHLSKDKIKSCFICLTLSVESNNKKNCNIYFYKSIPQCLDNPTEI